MTDLLSEGEGSVGGALSGGQLEKAYLLILPPSSPAGGAASAAMAAASTGAEDLSGTSGEGSTMERSLTPLSGAASTRISLMFNPLRYSVSKGATWERTTEPGAVFAAVPVFLGSEPRSLSVEVLLDGTYKQASVQADVDLLFACCMPTATSLAFEMPSPPFVIFGWGSNLGFLSFMESVSAEYTLFKPDGTPLRASCTLTMKEIPVGLPGQNPTSGGSARKMRTVLAGDTLQSIAFREYGRPRLWRAIADANGIDDPLRLKPGTNLFIPRPSEASEVG